MSQIQSNSKANSGGVEVRKEGEEHHIAWRNNKVLLNIEQSIDSLTEKMSTFELKLNYVLLRQPKFIKRKKVQQQHGAAEIIMDKKQEYYQNKLSVITKKLKVRTSLIFVSLMLICIYVISTLLSELILANNDLDF